MRDLAERTSRYRAHEPPAHVEGLRTAQRIERTNKTALSTLAGLVIRGEQNTYELRKQIGRGAMGSVYLAYHSGGEVPVAVKILHGELCKRIPTALQRCLRGAGSIRRVKHENIVRVMEYGTTDDGIGFVVMEYVDGTDLDSVLAWKGPLPWQQVARIGVQLGKALAAAHQKGMIHRDVKPANCLLVNDTNRELVKLADFGISREFRLASEDGITGVNMLVGTPDYLAPECLHSGTLTPQMDIYSLGVTLYKLVTGVLPFQADSPEAVLKQKMRATPVPPSEILQTTGDDWPKHLDTVILRAMSRYPQGRFKTAADLVRALETYVLMRATVPFDELPTQSLSSRQKTVPFVASPVESNFRFGGSSSGTDATPSPEVTSEFAGPDEPALLFQGNAPEPFPWLFLGLHATVLAALVAIVVLVLLQVGLPGIPTGLPSEGSPSQVAIPEDVGSPRDPTDQIETLSERENASVHVLEPKEVQAPPSPEVIVDGNPGALEEEPAKARQEGVRPQPAPELPDTESESPETGSEPSHKEPPHKEPEPPVQTTTQDVRDAAKKRINRIRAKLRKQCGGFDLNPMTMRPSHSKIHFGVEVQPSGDVQTVTFRPNDQKSHGLLVKCIEQKVRQVIFEQTGKKVTVKTSITF